MPPEPFCKKKTIKEFRAAKYKAHFEMRKKTLS